MIRFGVPRDETELRVTVLHPKSKGMRKAMGVAHGGPGKPEPKAATGWDNTWDEGWDN